MIPKWTLGIGLEAFHRTRSSSRSAAILDHSRSSSIIVVLKFRLLQSGVLVVSVSKLWDLTRKQPNARIASIDFMSIVLQCPLNLDLTITFGRDSKLVWMCNFCAFPNSSTTFLLDNLDSFANNSYQSLESNNPTTGSAPDSSYSLPTDGTATAHFQPDCSCSTTKEEEA